MMRFAETAGWLASLCYASGYKRLGRRHLSTLILALTVPPTAQVVMSGRLPATH